MDQAAYFEQIRQNRKNEILTVAQHMILTQGYASFTMQNLAKELDLSTVTLYKYYKNSNGILSALMEQTLQHATSFFETTSSKDNGVEQLLLLLEEALLGILRDRKHATLLVLYEMNGDGPSIFSQESSFYHTYTQRILQSFHHLLVQAQQQGYVPAAHLIADDVDYTVTLCLAMLEHIALLDADTFQQKKKALTQSITHLIDMLRQYLESSIS